MYVLVSNLHFPQVKLAPEKPPEAVAKFSWGVCTQTPLDYGVQSTPSLIHYGDLAGQVFFLLPMTLSVYGDLVIMVMW